MPLGKVQSRGQVTLPREVRRAARIVCGDVLDIEVLGPGRMMVTALPKRSPRELRERYPIEGPIDEANDRRAWQEGAAAETLGRRGD